MLFYDMDSEHTFTLPEVYSAWQELKEAEPWNHAEHFINEMFEIIMATINDRNNLEIVGMMPKEIDGLIQRIRKELSKNDSILLQRI